jgi:hypothetical protein
MGGSAIRGTQNLLGGRGCLFDEMILFGIGCWVPHPFRSPPIQRTRGERGDITYLPAHPFQPRRHADRVPGENADRGHGDPPTIPHPTGSFWLGGPSSPVTAIHGAALTRLVPLLGGPSFPVAAERRYVFSWFNAAGATLPVGPFRLQRGIRDPFRDFLLPKAELARRRWTGNLSATFQSSRLPSLPLDASCCLIHGELSTL